MICERTAIVLIISFLLSITYGCSSEEKEQRFPSEIDAAISDSVFALLREGEVTSRDEFEEQRNILAKAWIDDVRTDSLTRSDSLTYGSLLFWSGQTEAARAILEDISEGIDKQAKYAHESMITMEIETGNYEIAEELMTKYRELYPPSPDDAFYLYEQAEDLGGRYNDMNRLDDAIRVYIGELNCRPFDTLCVSFRLTGDLMNVCQETGRLDVLRDALAKMKQNLTIGLERSKNQIAETDSMELVLEHAVKTYKRYIDTCDQMMTTVDMIGKPAPRIEFTHVYNGDSTLSLDAFKGQVLVLDFWNTWCVPCVIGFKEIKTLLADYGDKGLRALGVTSFQGYYRNVDTGEVEDELDEQREIEITGEYIEKREITWPVGIGAQSIFKNTYNILSVPTFVVIDREGNIRYVHSAVGQLKQKRRVIERLL